MAQWSAIKKLCATLASRYSTLMKMPRRCHSEESRCIPSGRRRTPCVDQPLVKQIPLPPFDRLTVRLCSLSLSEVERRLRAWDHKVRARDDNPRACPHPAAAGEGSRQLALGKLREGSASLACQKTRQKFPSRSTKPAALELSGSAPASPEFRTSPAWSLICQSSWRPSSQARNTRPALFTRMTG